MVKGEKVEVFMTPEWARYFQGLTGQVNDSAATVFSITSNGAAGLMQEDGGGSVDFIPGPQGAPGEPGPAGPAIFLLQEPEDVETFWPTKNT